MQYEINDKKRVKTFVSAIAASATASETIVIILDETTVSSVSFATHASCN